MSDRERPSPGELRWQRFLRQSTEPLFLLNRQRRLLFANTAWEQCTGLTLADVRGQPCRIREKKPDRDELTLAALAPPAEALAGQSCRARRRVPGGAGWWQLDFFPLLGPDGLLGILGKITPLPTSATGASPLPDRLMALRDRHAESYRLDALPRELPAMRQPVEQARLAAASHIPVTLIGEAGAGKRWLARAIHQASARRDRSFATLDCRSLPATLVGELLFEPRGRRLALGTVYLREPVELPAEFQQVLAAAFTLDDGSEGARIIVGHRQDPAEPVRIGRLSAELHAATSLVTITIPPLRDRLADLETLVPMLLERVRLLSETKVAGISPDALLTLRSHAWPGNLRELAEVLAAACRHARTDRIERADLPYYLRQGPMPADTKLPLDALLEQAERRLIALALKHAKGNHTRAAEILGIWRPRLLRRLEHFGIQGKESP